jgi:hypothetical protein
VPDGESHGHYGQSKGQGYTQETDAQAGKSGGQNRAAAPAQNQPECSKKFCAIRFHKNLLCLEIFIQG